METKGELLRKEAVRRYQSGEAPHDIFTSLSKSKSWFFKWLDRYNPQDSQWFKNRSRAPKRVPNKTDGAMETLVVEIRKKLAQTKYSQIGVMAIQWAIKQLGQKPPPPWTINRIVKRHGLVQKKVRYQPKGKPYPRVGLPIPDSVQQVDILGPRYIRGDGRFYSVDIIDAYSHQLSLTPSRDKSDETVALALIHHWKTYGMADFLQMDNYLSFRGSNRWPRSFGLVIRLCLSLGIQPVFIPLNEPWRNGVLEKFHEVYQRLFFSQEIFNSYKNLEHKSKEFERFHNEYHRYHTLGGKTPNQIIAEKRCGPSLLSESYQLPEEKISLEHGYIHLIRFIRSDRQLDVFGEQFTVDKGLIYEYVKATICTEIHCIKLYLENDLQMEIPYYIPID